MITKEVYEEQKALSDRWKAMYYEKKNELDQLTNNWNELEEWLKNEYNEWSTVDDEIIRAEARQCIEVLDKMKEIKERNNE